MNHIVSIITVNYNNYSDTCEFIDSLSRYETYPYELIIVDNASRNNEGERLKKKYPGLTVICSPVNLGFAGGNNLGYTHAKGFYIVYMNNDMLIDRPFLQPLTDRLKNTPYAGAVSPKIKYSYARDIIQYAGFTDMSPITLRNRMIGTREKDRGQYDEARETAFIHGACMLTSRNILEKTGQMTEIFFLFYEELDWSLRLRQAGYTLWYEPDSTVYHKESISIPKGTPLRQYYMTRSRLLFARRNYSGISGWLSCLYQMTIALPKNLLIQILKGEWKMAGASWRGAWKGLTDKSK